MKNSLIYGTKPTGSIQTRSIHTVLYEWIAEIAGELEAINATSWAELACLDEEYEGEGFKLKVID